MSTLGLATLGAAPLTTRTTQWLAPIPIGWILLLIMRGRHWREVELAPDGPIEARSVRTGAS